MSTTVRERPRTHTAPTPEDDARLRGLIRAELDRQHARPVARRTLELLAEAAVEPSSEEPGYRVMDRDGRMRLQRDLDPDAERGDVTAPMSLRDLVAELRQRHPALFQPPPEPDPQPVPPPPPEPAHDALAEAKAAGARFVETQSARARTLATSAATSAERGRVLASAAGARFETWRAGLGARLRARPTPAAATVPPDTPATQAPPPGTAPERPAGRLAAAAGRLREEWPARAGDALDRLRSRAVAIGGGAVLVAGLAGLAVLALGRGGDATREGAPQQEGRQEIRQEARQEPPPAAEERAAVAPAEPPPEDAEARPAEEAPAPRDPNAVVGVPQVIDTATLRVGGKVVRLFGVEWVRGGQADELSRYLHGRTVTCRPAAGSTAHLCAVDGRDLSEVVLFNGGGRASAEASPDLVAAEDHARGERVGVWKR